MAWSDWIDRIVGWLHPPRLDHPLLITKQELASIKNNLKMALANHPALPIVQYSAEQQACIDRVQRQTDAANRNNITRTKAYLELYTAHPELHWALLAHLVSRNGGWNMTDLRGELVGRLLTDEQCEAVFAFLERSNALIFQDAYPQLLLYSEGLKSKTNLTDCLDAFYVSRYMKVFWNDFWLRRNSTLLTISLIVNEQNFIEQRVIKNNEFQHSLFNTLFFKAQALLQLNQIIFPISIRQKVRFIGCIIEDFTNLSERIEVGKCLYAAIFGMADHLELCKQYTESVEHTGSRADYYPQWFSTVKKAPPTKWAEGKMLGCKLREGSDPFYSPMLRHVWPDRPIAAIERGDWFRDLSWMKHFNRIQPPVPADMTDSYCLAMNELELAVLALQKLHLR